MLMRLGVEVRVGVVVGEVVSYVVEVMRTSCR